MPGPHPVRTSADDEIRARISARGRVPFAEFMELALYHPADGYYSAGAPIGARGDYYTSPAAHPAFGALIAVMLQRMWDALGRPLPFHAVEMGAGDGLLARDVASFIPRLSGDLARAIRYVTLDRTSRTQQRESDGMATRQVIATGAPLKHIVGCLFSNELVDAFPVAMFEVQDGAPREVYVTDCDGEPHEELGDPSTPALVQALAGLDRELPEGYRGEVNVGMASWVAEVSRALHRGFAVTIDYGYADPEPYPLDRRAGTLRTHFGHAASSNPYQHIGAQDITAHVDFAALARLGEDCGLTTLGIVSQARFLRTLGLERWFRDLRAMGLPQRDRDANMMAMRDLVEPGGLGGFGVLVQEKNSGIARLDGFLTTSVTELPHPPLLDPAHTPLLEGRYPHAAWQPPQGWNLS